MATDSTLFDALRRDVADFPDGEISVESKEIAALLEAYDDLRRIAGNAYATGYADAAALYTGPRRA